MKAPFRHSAVIVLPPRAAAPESLQARNECDGQQYGNDVKVKIAKYKYKKITKLRLVETYLGLVQLFVIAICYTLNFINPALRILSLCYNNLYL